MQASQLKRAATKLAGSALMAAGLLAMAAPGWATEQSQQRQQGRDVKQDTRQDARKTKIDCKQESNKSNSECRQDKRDSKQEGREQARDIKR